VAISTIFAIFPASAVRISIDLITENLSLYSQFSGSYLQTRFYEYIGTTLLVFAVLVIAFAILRGLFMYLMRQTIIVMSRYIEFDLKNEIFSHYQTLPLSFYRKHNTGDLMARISEDVSRVRMYVGPAVMYGINLIVTIILVVYVMFHVNARMALLVLIPLPLLSFAIFYVNNIINRKSDAIQSKLSEITSFVQEAISGIRVIKSFAVENASEIAYGKLSNEYRDRQLSLAKVDAIFFPLIAFLTGLSTLITIFFGGLEVIHGKATIGNIAEFIIYVNLLTWPVASLGYISSMIQRAAASQNRINEFLNTKADIVFTNLEPFTFNKNIEFRNVSYCYPGKIKPAIENLNFKIKKAQNFAILGGTGSGKSTLIYLLLRMIDCDEGEILIDGINIKDLNLYDYKKQVGYVPQDVFLFSDTIANNIAFGIEENLETKDQVVIEAAEKAALASNILEFPKKFETIVGERGVTLSGGQKQRTAIARAIVKNPNILIFDDCLSAVDTKTESEILQNLKDVMLSKTNIIVSHRVSSIKDSDYTILLEDGKISEEGKHSDLMDKEGKYFEIYNKQLLEEKA